MFYFVFVKKTTHVNVCSWKEAPAANLEVSIIINRPGLFGWDLSLAIIINPPAIHGSLSERTSSSSANLQSNEFSRFPFLSLSQTKSKLDRQNSNEPHFQPPPPISIITTSQNQPPSPYHYSPYPRVSSMEASNTQN